MPQLDAIFDHSALDSRLVRTQVERAAKALGGTVASSPIWVVFFAFMCSSLVRFFGNIPVPRSALVVVLVCTAMYAGHLVLDRYHRRHATSDREADERWLNRLMALSAALSFVWGLAPWLLWDPKSPENHIFIDFISLALIARILVNRANHLPFFFASFGPMASMLFFRCLIGFDAADLVLAAMVPLYGIQVVIDCRYISRRWDNEAMTRYSFEDMSREIEEARDDALMKRAEAEAANASKTTFLANMSHELRTPLNAILGFSEIIARECLGPVGSPRYKEYAGDIHTSGSHLLSLINDLLDVAKIEAGRMEIEPHMIETERTLEVALKFVASKAREKNQALNVHVDDDAAVLFADERAVKQVVINLASNAVKFTPEGGRIDIRARRNGERNFELSVSDNGPGIAKEKLDRIFRPFSRVDNRYDSEAGGTGLGLALVRGLVELHGGRAWIESDSGKGTTVYVVLPMSTVEDRSKERLQA